MSVQIIFKSHDLTILCHTHKNYNGYARRTNAFPLLRHASLVALLAEFLKNQDVSVETKMRLQALREKLRRKQHAPYTDPWQKKEAYARRMLKSARYRIKRAQAAEKRWKRRAAYYEKKKKLT